MGLKKNLEGSKVFYEKEFQRRFIKRRGLQIVFSLNKRTLS